MKRIIKRILPILLCLIVIISIAWYLLQYDPAFTQDMLVGVARHFESQGNHSIATWLYNQAYYQCGGDDAVIIELAERFKANNNYTKAEVTLSKAIAEGGSVELYIALCKTYVEQDKLLDAATMLENVPDPAIKAELDALRPAAPVANPTQGFYSQYITVSFEDTDSQLYVSHDGAFPSTETDLYTAGIQLTGGENILYAISVGENGLVSPGVHFGYTIGGVIEEITIEDPALDALLREQLGVDAETQLMSSDLWSITSLTVPQDTKDLSDLIRLPYLQTLIVENIDFPSMQMLSALTQLKQLTVRGCALSGTDLTAIAALPNLEHLVLSDCSLSSIKPLSNAKNLVTLDLSKNTLRDISPLSFMDKLISLNVSNNALTDLNSLSALTTLQELDVSYNSLTSVAALRTCTALIKLNLSNNQLDKMAELPDTALQRLDLSSNTLTDVENLAAFTSLTELDISSNQLTDISPLSALNKLNVLRFSRNSVSQFPQWKSSCALTTIDASYNKLTSVAPLKGLFQLNRVNLDYNNISNVNPLADCHNLILVDIFGNPVWDVSKLTDQNIIVNYDPT